MSWTTALKSPTRCRTTGVKAMGANLPMGGNQIKSMADPTVSTDAATKNYVDNFVPGKVLAIQILTTTGTYTRTTGATHGDVYVIGSGGAGGGAGATGAGQAAIGGGGGGGGISIGYNVVLPATQAFTIGAGGVAVSGAAGGNGNTTTFGTISANGAAGGGIQLAITVSSAATAGPGGGGAVGSGGTINFTGMTGSPGFLLNSLGFGGAGGNSPFIGGGTLSSVGVGIAATNFGAGGSGALNGASASAKAGGNGAPGAIIIVERS